MSFPGVSTYSASKFALEGWAESLAGEVAPFGIAVMLVEPSRFRTAFNTSDTLAFADKSPAYHDVLADVRADMAGADGIQEGDPAKAAHIIVSLVHDGTLPLRLPLGAEAVERLTATFRRGLENIEAWADTARSAVSSPPPPRRGRSSIIFVSTDELMTKALAVLSDVDGPMSVEVIHRLADTSDVTDPMSIADVAQLLDVSSHTLRYYERAGLLTVARDSNGHRGTVDLTVFPAMTQVTQARRAAIELTE